MSSNAFAVVYVDRKASQTGCLSNKNLDGLKEEENGSDEAAHNIRAILAAFGQGTSVASLSVVHLLTACPSPRLRRRRLLLDYHRSP